MRVEVIALLGDRPFPVRVLTRHTPRLSRPAGPEPRGRGRSPGGGAGPRERPLEAPEAVRATRTCLYDWLLSPFPFRTKWVHRA